jgi:class 3 adenylate cyclase
MLGNVYRHDLENRVVQDMREQLQTVATQVENKLETFEKDTRFLASLDVMNDVLSGDLDKRITAVLIDKKHDLRLDGDFHVLDTNETIVASSDAAMIGTPFSGEADITQALLTDFTDAPVGSLVLDYRLDTLRSGLPQSDTQTFKLLAKDTEESSETHPLKQTVVLDRRPDLKLVLQRDRDSAFGLLENLQTFFALGLLLAALLISALAYLLAGYLVKPILELAQTARQITRTEDYSRRVSIEGEDEIGILANAFNRMLSGMQELLTRVQEESENKLKLAQEQNRAEMLQTLSNKLSKYLSPQVYESIFSGERDVTLTSSRKKLTVFFSDIVNFTDTTDQMESEDLTQLLNEYLSEMSDIALQYGATIDKYIGDAIMIFFGDPRSQGVEEDAVLCIQMAIAMQERMRTLQERWRAQGFSRPLSIRIGIHTGYCTVGNFGTENRMDYTILGSPVNLASRIEGQAEPGTIYISEETYLLVHNRIACIPSKMVTPKGFSNAIQLYQVLDSTANDALEIIEGPGFSITIDHDRMSSETLQTIKSKLTKMEVSR